MEYIIGTLLALAVSVFATVTGLDRGRSFYPTVTIVIVSYYGLFAVMGGSGEALATEAAVIAGFILISVLGFRFNLWLLVAALIGHGAFDFVHGHVISNPGVPAWWPAFCMTYDITAAGYLAWLLGRSVIPASTNQSPFTDKPCQILVASQFGRK